MQEDEGAQCLEITRVSINTRNEINKVIEKIFCNPIFVLSKIFYVLPVPTQPKLDLTSCHSLAYGLTPLSLSLAYCFNPLLGMAYSLAPQFSYYDNNFKYWCEVALTPQIASTYVKSKDQKICYSTAIGKTSVVFVYICFKRVILRSRLIKHIFSIAFRYFGFRLSF